MQQSDFWQQQAKNNLISPELMQQAANPPARPANLPTAISNLLPSAMPPLFVAPPLLPNATLLSTPSTAALPVGEQQPQSNTVASLNGIPSSYLSPAGLSYDLMLRTLSLNAATSIQQQHQNSSVGQSSASALSHGFLNHLRELSADAQSNESNNFKLTTEHAIKGSSLDFRSSSSASNSSDCSSPSPQPTNNYLANSSSSSLSSHTSINNSINSSINNSMNSSINNPISSPVNNSIGNSISNSITNSISNSINSINNSINSINAANFNSAGKSSNRSLKNLKQINTSEPGSSPANSPNLLFQSNGSLSSSPLIANKPAKMETKNESSSPKVDLKNDLSAIERFNTVLGHHSSDLIMCGSSNKPLFQPYLSKLN